MLCENLLRESPWWTQRIGILSSAVAVLTSLSAVPVCHASEDGSILGGEIRLQAGTGGDKPVLEEAAAIEGGLPALSLGDHFFIGLGIIVSPYSSGKHAAEIELLGGFSSWSTGDNASADRITTFGVPLNLLAFYRYQLRKGGQNVPVYLRAGGGLAYHTAQGIGSYGKYGGINYAIDDAFGAVFEASIVYAVVGAGLRYTRIGSNFEGEDKSWNMSSFAGFVSIIIEPGLEL